MITYPKMIRLKDGTEITLRLMVKEDRYQLMEFFQGLSEAERAYLRADVIDPRVIDRWVENINYKTVLPILAIVDGKVIGDSTLHMQEFGWTADIGEIRVVVADAYQKKGLGTILMKELLDHAMEIKLYKIEGQVIGEQKSGIAIMKKVGFRHEATLKHYVKDFYGNRKDLLIFTQLVEELWRKIEDAIADLEICTTGIFSE